MPHRVLHQRLQAQERQPDRQHLGRDLQPHLEPLAEPGPLDRQVPVDRAQLLGERRELTVRPEAVPGELGELQDQLAGALRVGTHERGDRGQRVVDEVRADLRPQRPHLGPGQPGPGRVELGERELGADPAAGLPGGLHQPGCRRAVRQRDERAAAQRHHHRAADHAVDPVAGQVTGGQHGRPAAAECLRRRGQQLVPVVVAGTVEGQHASRCR